MQYQLPLSIKGFIQILGYLTLTATLSSCGEDTFSEEKPFAVMVHQYRYPQEAIAAKQRLEAMSLSPYLIAYEPVGEGPWYGVFLGASESLEGMLKAKIKLEDKYGLKKVERANFHQVNAVQLEFPNNPPLVISAHKRATSMAAPIGQLLDVMPQLPNFQLKEIKLLSNTEDSGKLFSNLKIDFPRGIVPRQLYQSFTGLASAFYEDALIGKEMHLIALQLKEEHPYGEDPAERFAESILGTRRYEIENMSPVSGGIAAGYTVSIVPAPGKTKHYLVLYEPNQRLLFLGESNATAFSIGDWQQVARSIGGEKSTWDYYELQQMLQWAPDSIADPLVYFRTERWEGRKVKGASLLHGNLKASYTFISDSTKKPWEAQLYRFASTKNANGYYRQIFKKAKLSKSLTVDSLQLGLPETALYSKKRRIRWKKYEITPNKMIGFDGKSHIGSFSFKKSGLSAEQMASRVKEFGWEK